MRFEIKNSGKKRVLIVYNDDRSKSDGFLIEDKDLYALYVILRDLFKGSL